MTLTVIADAQAAYDRLRDKALARHPDQEGYIRGLHASWSGRLFCVQGEDTRRAQRRLAFLTREIDRDDLDDDALMRWLDAYPEAIVEAVEVAA